MESHSQTDLRCLLKGGGGWECKGWRIVGSNFCQKHYNYFEERKSGMKRRISIEAAKDETKQHQVQIEEDETGYTNFMEGQEVEVLKSCSWCTAKILKLPNRKGKSNILVDYDNVVLGMKRSVPFSREFVDPSLIRPKPSPSTQVFGLNDVVEAFHKEGWWKGEVAKVHECSGSTVYTIYFPDLGEKIDTGVDKLRVHQVWVGGKWVRPQEDMEAGKQLRDQVPQLFDVSVCIIDGTPINRDARDLDKGEQSQVHKAVEVFDTSCTSVKMYSKTKRHKKGEVTKGSSSHIEDHEKSILVKPVIVPGTCNHLATHEEESHHDTKSLVGDEINQEKNETEQTTTFVETTMQLNGNVSESLTSVNDTEAGSFPSIKNNSMWETFNTMSIDQLEKLLRLKTQLEELKQVEGKIVKEKQEEESLKVMVEKIDEKLKELRKSRTEMEKKQERIVMKSRENGICVVTLEKKVQEIEEEMVGIGLRFNRVAGCPW